ncbi:MAG: hypothetical protein H7Z42_23060 [Roseiflexaceae bacterium]|nr:hypothetical protein [Roseiflexaceae bacterium]
MFEFFWYVWRGITQSMALNPRVAEVVEQSPESGRVVLVIAILGGMGLLLGQSVILFVNRVRPARFVLSLLLNGIVFTISLVVWALAIWAIGRFVFQTQPPLGLVMRLVGLSAAPYVFGVLVLIPYFGEFIYRVLSVWSSIIAVGATAFSFAVGWWPAFLVVGGSWLLIWALTNTLGRPLLAARNRAWQVVSGTSMDASVADILTQFAVQGGEGDEQRKP